MKLDAKIPDGPIEKKWDNHRFKLKLVNPANKRKYTVIVVGSGLAGGSAAATLGELGYNVKCFYYQDSARRAHSIADCGSLPRRLPDAVAARSGANRFSPIRSGIVLGSYQK